ncbi:MAG: LysM peptidoglycan-binding domain-containing protein [Prevotellaceae bacterium]|nr:LysM peptidoglycan-binding domain-containing protein [Prevotellaceae bacterium]
MKRYLLTALLTVATSSLCFATDHIIFRNGQEGDVKLYQISDDEIIFAHAKDKTGSRRSIPIKDVYMIYIEKQGNVYITPEGKRVTGEAQRIEPKKSDVIYLVKGAEIAAENIRITEDDIHYFPKTKKGSMWSGKTYISDVSLSKSDVFMIKYKTGMTDIITPIDIIEEPVDTTAEEEEKIEYLVIFYSVLKGETLETIAEKFNVTTAEILEWNDLPANSNTKAILTTGFHLMIYQPKQSN